ncbi:cytochrome P450 [Sistotremastrum niveocremeum HHB9708]|uniref:Cytochrome P450 n=1 Tax=Sistotremastrum niveocremeum HHB9708 TaxID=1314777 RepID=A0A164ZVB8_9AGAM|nr:cytochrome P450 [Sistotremastrum niveocremeum HHB9708]
MSPISLPLSQALPVLGALLFSYVLLRKILNSYTNSAGLPYPPGPKGVPILGNALQITDEKPWLLYKEWASKWGDIIGLRVLGKNIIVVNSYQAGVDLFEKRGRVFSGRPKVPLFSDIARWDFSLLVMDDGKSVRLIRKFIAQFANSAAVKDLHALITENARALALRTAATQDDGAFYLYSRSAISKNILQITYGYQSMENGDQWIKNTELMSQSLAVMGTIGAHPIDVFPILGKLPLWIWGKTFIQCINNLRTTGLAMSVTPYNDVKQQYLEKSAPPCVLTHLLDEKLQEDGTVQDEWEVMVAAATAYTAGVDTTTASINSATIFLMTYPEIQTRVQEELDDYLHGERLPKIEDRETLPYFSAVLREIMRFNPVVPLALPRRATEDCEYNGLLIPENSIVSVNVWAILRDENEYPEPSKFKPERFLETRDGKPALRSDVLDPHSVFFGIGRRNCSGQQLALDSVWITLATLLTVFEIRAPDGIEQNYEYENGLFAQPKPFKCRFTVRSKSFLSALETAVA